MVEVSLEHVQDLPSRARKLLLLNQRMISGPEKVSSY